MLKDPILIKSKTCFDKFFNGNGSLICTQIFPDNFMKREVLSLVVTCPNSPDGCKWKGEVRHIEVSQSQKSQRTNHATNRK